jgi:hypothetical protein
MKYKRIIFFVTLLVVCLIIVQIAARRSVHAPVSIDTGSTISYTNGASIDLVKDLSIKPGDIITSPLKMSGMARGTWYFEASFPVALTDGDGLIIAEGPAQAQSSWMTTDFVPFEATLTFTKPANASAFGDRATLILKNDNPSGDPARDMTVEVPLKFK